MFVCTTVLPVVEITLFLKALSYYRYLKDDLVTEVQKQLTDGNIFNDIRWVLTVPAIWKDNAKQFMREAANRVHVYTVGVAFNLRVNFMDIP